MTKKDYIIIAQAINAQRYAGWQESKIAQQCLNELCWVLAGKMIDDNPRFDRDKFLSACGVGKF